MTGQKVIKVFCHEEAAKADFDKVNGEIFYNARNGNRFANILMPLLGNIGNIMYVVVALAGGALLLTDVTNISFSGMAFSISIVVPFLNMTKQFAGAIGQVSNQINMVIMGLAGAHRIFALLDEQPETDEGYVTLVNAKENADGSMSECVERTNVWAWKHQHHDGTLTYTRLDEATSSIDTRTEAIVQRGMEALMTGRTVFIIAHRLSTVRNADAIMVLDHGRIIERGTHEELLKLKGTYYQLYTGALELD